MKINAVFDTSRLDARLLKDQKRLVYNTVEALNKTALAAQAGIRADIEKNFNLRSGTKQQKDFLLKQIKVKFASVKKGVLAAEIYVATKPRLLLALFEKGGERAAFVGKNVAQPISVNVRVGGTEKGVVKEDLTFKQLKFKRVKVRAITRPDTVQFKGAHRTFIIKSSDANPGGGVYQRVGPGTGRHKGKGQDDLRILYKFARPFNVKRLLTLVATANAMMADKFRVEYAIASARDIGR